MTFNFRQNGQYTKFQVQAAYVIIVLFLALWNDVIEGSPNPKPNGYQRAIPWGACGAKGLGMFAQTPVSGPVAFPDTPYFHHRPRMPQLGPNALSTTPPRRAARTLGRWSPFAMSFWAAGGGTLGSPQAPPEATSAVGGDFWDPGPMHMFLVKFYTQPGDLSFTVLLQTPKSV